MDKKLSRQAINAIHQGLPDFQDHLIPEPEVIKKLLKERGYSEIKTENTVDRFAVKAKKLKMYNSPSNTWKLLSHGQILKK